MKKVKHQIKTWGTKTGIALVLAILGTAAYLAFSIHFANTQRSTIDEGLFLYKGYLFASGVYHPFQDFGPRTQYGPLSYLIPGFIQLWFGPGLLAGRVFAVITGFMALVGLWAAARRLAGPWWAAAVVWAAALSTAVIRFHSFGQSQGLVECLLMWMVFFAIGKRNSAWQTSLSAVLAGLILLTRQNMAPVLPILLIYIFWQHGRRQGLITTLAGVIVVVIGHAVFWPGILEMWAPWLPARLTSFLDAWRLPEGITPAVNFQPTWKERLLSLLEGFRFHFTALAGSILSLILWPARTAWKSEPRFRTGLFLGALFFSLFGLNAWAGLGFVAGNNFNAFTFNPYLAFFTYLGLLLTVAVFTNSQWHLSTARKIALSVLIILIFAGIGYGGFESTGETLLALPVPRVQNFFATWKFLPGHASLWDYLANGFGLTYEISRRLIPLLSGCFVGLLVFLASLAIWSFFKRKGLFQFPSYGTITVGIFILAGTLLSPSIPLGGGFTSWNCTGNVIQTYERAGESLKGVLSLGDQIYWEGGNAVAVLLYTPGIQVHPQQLDGQWNYWLDGDPELLSRLGSWNQSLALQWRQDADVIILQQRFLNADWQTYLQVENYSEVLRTNEFMNCTPDSILAVYRR